MRSLTKTSAYALAWLVPIFWACLMVGSFKVPGPLTEPETLRLLIWTVLAAASVKYYAGDRWPLTQAAFIVLCAGVVRLIFAFNVYSLAGVAIALLAAGWMTFEHRRRLPAPVAALTPASAPFTPAAAQPYSPPNYAARGQAPSAPPAAGQGPAPASARYDFTHKFKAPGHNFSRVLGMAETKERLLNAAFEIVNSEDGAKPRNGIMLDGDPGNGKTFLAEALAGELQLPFFGATYNDIATMYVGEPIEKLTVLFQQVVARAPCVLFLDEFDSFMAARGTPNGTPQDDKLVNTLLTELVNLRRHKVVLIAATNHLDKLDEAGVREGRFDFKVEVPPPDLKAREGLLRLGIVKALGPQAVDAKVIESVAARWEGFSVVRLTSVCEELKDMRREGKFGAGVITFETAMQAMRRIQGRSGKLPPDAKSVAEIIMPSQSREKLNDLVYKMKNVYKLEEMGGKLAPGLAFWGPPGTGKTEGAMALAKDSEWAFFSVSGADLLANFSLWDKTVREARNCRPSIIFIDEADRVLGDRSYSNCAALTDKIMETMSGSKGRLHDVIVIAATNRLDRFDPAVVRGARFEEKIRFDVPDADQMREYVGQKLAKLAGDRFGSHDAVTERAVAVLSGQSIANANAVLQKVIDIAAVRVLRGSEPELRLSDVDEAAESVFADLSADD